jgi:hypothetical protein
MDHRTVRALEIAARHDVFRTASGTIARGAAGYEQNSKQETF